MSATRNDLPRLFWLGAGFLIGLSPTVPAAASGFVGAEVCAACHVEAAAIWRASAHARAATTLTDTERELRACQACHATGDAPATPAARPGVQCEACHAPGADYASDDVMRDQGLARALGLRDLATVELRTALCLGCHAADRRRFAPEIAWRQIAH